MIYTIFEDRNKRYAVFSWNDYGDCWQQCSKWYFRRGYAKRYKEKLMEATRCIV